MAAAFDFRQMFDAAFGDARRFEFRRVFGAREVMASGGIASAFEFRRMFAARDGIASTFEFRRMFRAARRRLIAGDCA